MPGIAGILNRPSSPETKSQVEQMVKTMLHDKGYASGTLLEPKSGAAAGWVCHKDSFSDCQPIWNETRDVALVFSGEHFADEAEARGLRASGHRFPDANASYLVHLYEEMGMRFFERLNGAFSGLVIDLRENKVILFNDRYGLGRIYFHEEADGFYFASEAKSLLKLLPQLRQLDWRSFGELFVCGCALENRTLFSGVSLFPAGSIWTFRPGQPIQKETYFHREDWENQPSLSPAEYYEQLKDVFGRTLPAYFRGSQQVALSLTGGLDSRMILAEAKFLPFKLQTYTFGGMNRECADVQISRRLAKAAQQYHEVFALHKKFFTEFPSLAKKTVYYTDGAMDVSGTAAVFANRMAKEMAPVRLTGNYGSEILRGHICLRPRTVREAMFAPAFVPHVRRAAITCALERIGPLHSFIAFKQVPWHHYAMLAAEQTQLTIRSPFLDNELVRLAFQFPPGMVDRRDLILRLIGERAPALIKVPTDRGQINRPPLVPGRAWNWCKEFMPRAEYVYDYGMPQWFAKVDRVLSPLRLERFFLGRQKFYNYRTWYQAELAHCVKDVLLDPETLSRSWLEKNHVEKMVIDHLQKRGNHTTEIHKLLTAEFIQRQLIEGF